MFKITVITGDGSEWLLDEKDVRDFWNAYKEAVDFIDTTEGFHEWLLNNIEFYGTLEDWLLPNAKVIKASQLLLRLLDGVNVYGDDDDEDDNPYANGYEDPKFRVEE